MKKADLLQRIIARLSGDLELFLTAAKSAHEAATHAETVPDNKYDTLALEASYVAQGQANRAQEIRRSLELYRHLELRPVAEQVCLTSFVTIEADDGTRRHLFIGPAEGGLKIAVDGTEVTVITPVSPLGRELLGKGAGDLLEVEAGPATLEYEIVAVR